MRPPLGLASTHGVSEARRPAMGPQVPMPITDFLNGFKADPETRRVVGVAFEMTRVALHLTDHNDPLVQLVANKIIGLAKAGERNPDRLCEQALGRPQQAALLGEHPLLNDDSRRRTSCCSRLASAPRRAGSLCGSNHFRPRSSRTRELFHRCDSRLCWRCRTTVRA